MRAERECVGLEPGSEAAVARSATAKRTRSGTKLRRSSKLTRQRSLKATQAWITDHRA